MIQKLVGEIRKEGILVHCCIPCENHVKHVYANFDIGCLNAISPSMIVHWAQGLQIMALCELWAQFWNYVEIKIRAAHGKMYIYLTCKAINNLQS